MGLTAEQIDFERADKVVHTVESEWHYQLMTDCGFVPVTKERTGFVRKYTYIIPGKLTVSVTTGVNSDYWESSDGNRGYWGTLEKYVKNLNVVID